MAERAMVASRSPARWVAVWSLLLSVAGLAVSVYLTIEHFTASSTLACPAVGALDCVKVTTSAQSVFLGVPVALLGLLFFVAMVAINLPVVWRLTWPPVRAARIGLTLLGVGFVIYLIYAELFLVDAICLWCTAVHVLTLALFGVVALGSAAQQPAGD